jgi:uncharacterized DUF497 family protein
MKFAKPIIWDEDKNQLLRRERGVSFEEVSVALNGALLDVVDHPNERQYLHQKMLIVEIRNYAYVVPYVENEEHVFLKTIYPSRKATRDYLTDPQRTQQ